MIALAPVVAGWTGALEINGLTIPVHDRDSIAGIFSRALSMLRVRDDVDDAALRDWSVSVSSAGVLTIATTGTFDLVASGTLASRSGFSSTYTGASTYTAAAAYDGAVVPSAGIVPPQPALATDEGKPAADGGAGGGSIRKPAPGSMQVCGAFSEVYALETSEILRGVFDLWVDGRLFGRWRADKIVRRKAGRRADQAHLDVSLREVA